MSVAADEARAIVTDWLAMFDPPPQIDFQQSELLQQAIASALRGTDRIEALENALRWINAKTDDRLAAEFARAALAPEPRHWPQDAIDQEMIERTDDGWKADRE